MLSALGWTPGCRVAVLPGDGVYLFGERGSIVLRGAAYERIAPLLDGTRTTDEVVEALSATTAAADVYYALGQLVARGHVCEVNPAGSTEEAGFWGSLGLDASTVVGRLRATPVAVLSYGAVDVRGITAALGTVGVRVSAEEGRLAVVVTDDYLQPALADFNARALETGRPWLLCKPSGSVVWVGPLFRPEPSKGTAAGVVPAGVESPCWECLAQRLRWHRPVESYVQSRTGATGPIVLPRSALPGSEAVALTLAALQVARAVGADTAAGSENMVVTLDLSTMATRQHVVVRRPQCARCGHPLDPGRPPLPPRLRSEAAWFAADGGYRTVAPETTFARYQHHISPITGLVGELRRVGVSTDPPPLFHVYRSASGEAWGKGSTEAQARTAALCESLEMASARFRGDEPCVRATHRSLGHRALHPNACMLFSDRQYAHRESWNARSSRFRRIPEPFDEDAEIDWAHVWSLTHETFRLLPAAYCYHEHPGRPARCVSDHNGHAAGNTLEEAVLHALLELVERDAAAIWWLNRARRPPVDMEGLDDALARAARARAMRDGREIWVLDLTGDLGIPVFAAISRATTGLERISFGFGADLDRRIALVRALGEMHQMTCTFVDAKERSLQRWWTEATVADHPYLEPDALATPCPSLDRLDPTEPGSFGAILECRRRLERQGLEVLMLDQTRPDIGLPTAHVIVPGLRHWRPPGYAPGRLYDVPVRLGWFASPLPEDRLNPLSLPA